jgi:hypothetical protein
MATRTLSKIRHIGIIAVVATLSACGGGGSADTSQVPGAAVAAPNPSSVPSTSGVPALAHVPSGARPGDLPAVEVPVLAPAGTLPPDLPSPRVSSAPPCPPAVCWVTPANGLEPVYSSPSLPDELGNSSRHQQWASRKGNRRIRTCVHCLQCLCRFKPSPMATCLGLAYELSPNADILGEIWASTNACGADLSRHVVGMPWKA